MTVTAAVSQVPEYAVLSIRQLMVRRFRRNRLAVAGGCILLVMYLLSLFAGFVAPYGVRTTHDKFALAPPHGIHLRDAAGNFVWPPVVYGLESAVDKATFRKTFTRVPEETYPLRFFGKGVTYRMWGLFETDRHLFTVEEPGRIFLLGTDRQGRDLLSRILYGSQVSLTVGLLGVLVALVLGTGIGILSGYLGGAVDVVIQQLIAVLLSFPQIPLWLALATLVPPNWSSVRVYFGLSLVLSIVNWGGLARQVRGMVYALREEDFILSARYTNCSLARIVAKHLMPNTLGHVLVIATLAIPQMILGETALSFLGLGIRPPMTSWGLLLSEAQHVRVILQQTWLLLPAVFVIVTIICFNFLGDGLRDAADPFSA